MDDPIECDDPLEQLMWHAETKLAQLEEAMKYHRDKYLAFKRMHHQWSNHANIIRTAKHTRPMGAPCRDSDEEEIATQKCKSTCAV